MKNDATDQVKHDEVEESGIRYLESRIEYLEARLANALKLRDELLKERPHLHSAIDKLSAKVDENLRRAVGAERERDRDRLYRIADAATLGVTVIDGIYGGAYAPPMPEYATVADVERIVDAKLRAEESERRLAELRALRGETARRMAEVEAAVARQKEASGGE